MARNSPYKPAAQPKLPAATAMPVATPLSSGKVGRNFLKVFQSFCGEKALSSISSDLQKTSLCIELVGLHACIAVPSIEIFKHPSSNNTQSSFVLWVKGLLPEWFKRSSLVCCGGGPSPSYCQDCSIKSSSSLQLSISCLWSQTSDIHLSLASLSPLENKV